MTNRIPHADKKRDVLRVLMECAEKGDRLAYGNLGKLTGIPAQGPWKPLLDEISRDQTENGLPDITYLAVVSKTKLPHQIGFEDARRPTSKQKTEAARTIAAVYAYYRQPQTSTN